MYALNGCKIHPFAHRSKIFSDYSAFFTTALCVMRLRHWLSMPDYFMEHRLGFRLFYPFGIK